MSEENPGKEEIKESINKLAKKMEQKIIEDARLKIESGFTEEPTTEAYWKEQREKTLAEAEAAYICKRSLPQDPDLLNFVEMSPQEVHSAWLDSEEAKVRECVNALFPPMMVDASSFNPRDAWVDEMSKALSQFPQADAEDWKDSWDGKVSLEKHLAQTKHMSDMIDTQYQENKHLIITNRVLTILLIFSTAFGITAALAWLRCQ